MDQVRQSSFSGTRFATKEDGRLLRSDAENLLPYPLHRRRIDLGWFRSWRNFPTRSEAGADREHLHEIGKPVQVQGSAQVVGNANTEEGECLVCIVTIAQNYARNAL